MTLKTFSVVSTSAQEPCFCFPSLTDEFLQMLPPSPGVYGPTGQVVSTCSVLDIDQNPSPPRVPLLPLGPQTVLSAGLVPEAQPCLLYSEFTAAPGGPHSEDPGLWFR